MTIVKQWQLRLHALIDWLVVVSNAFGPVTSMDSTLSSQGNFSY